MAAAHDDFATAGQHLRRRYNARNVLKAATTDNRRCRHATGKNVDRAAVLDLQTVAGLSRRDSKSLPAADLITQNSDTGAGRAIRSENKRLAGEIVGRVQCDIEALRALHDMENIAGCQASRAAADIGDTGEIDIIARAESHDRRA